MLKEKGIFNKMIEESYNKEFFEKSINGALTEIKAGKSLFPKDESDHVWNDAHERCLRILSRYLDGEGLFQL